MTTLIIKNAQLTDRENLVNIIINGAYIEGIDDIVASAKEDTGHSKNIDDSNVYDAHIHDSNIYDTNTYDAKGNFVCSGFFESHIHLDKACILERCTIEQGDLDEAVEETGKAKTDFSEDDVFERASKVIEMAIKKVR